MPQGPAAGGCNDPEPGAQHKTKRERGEKRLKKERIR